MAARAPYVGQTVLFYSTAVANRDTINLGFGYAGVGAGPYAAMVTRLILDAGGNVIFVHLTVFPPAGAPFEELRVSRGSASNPNRYFDWAAPDPLFPS